MWAGNQKAWMAALGVLATGLIGSLFGNGEGPTADQVSEFSVLSGEMVATYVGSAVTYAIVWFKTNVTATKIMEFVPK
jgi:uncharacterized protein YcfJ